MDFALSEEQTAIRDMAAAFAAEELAPFAVEWDQAKHFPVKTLRKAAALGLAGIYTRADAGGSGLTRLD
ncbi:MAG: acyl-CoA dehydrogenase family protein, partial [Roseiarcus sp.]